MLMGMYKVMVSNQFVNAVTYNRFQDLNDL